MRVLLPLLAASAILAAAPPRTAAAQAPPDLQWTPLGTDASGSEWGDTSHIALAPDSTVTAWYKVKAANEPKSVVVQYAIDCVGFRLSLRRSITYDGADQAVAEESAPTPFYQPPPVRALQDFMRMACRRARGPS